MAEPTPAKFFRGHGRHMRRGPMPASPLTGDLIRCALARMHPSALGLDGWNLS